MKKLLFIALLFAACKPEEHDGFYYKHIVGPYAIDEDTVEIQGNRIINHVGFQRIRKGKYLPKEFKTEELFGLNPQFGKGYLILKTEKFIKIN